MAAEQVLAVKTSMAGQNTNISSSLSWFLMTSSIEIQPVSRIVGVIRPPGSKSITNRALVCAALAHGRSDLTGVLDSDDTRVMIQSLQRLGIELTSDIEASWRDRGRLRWDDYPSHKPKCSSAIVARRSAF